MAGWISSVAGAVVVFGLVWFLPGGAFPAHAGDWDTVRYPSAGTPEIVGGYANGCIGGAVALPRDGPGWQVAHPGRNRFYGHPQTIDFLERLAARVVTAGLGRMLVGDIAQPRGGPMNSGHASHEIGLDADIWLKLDLPVLTREERDAVDLPSVLDPVTRRVDPGRWTPAQAELVRLAATDPRVARIFVNPAIKLALCAVRWPDRSWLRVVRPWFAHEAHMHVRLKCPADQPGCVSQGPPGEGDGCDAELASWLKPPAPVTPAIAVPPRPKVRPALPAACGPVLAAPDVGLVAAGRP